MNGKILDIIQTFEKKYRVTFEVDNIDEINGLSEDLTIEVKKKRQKRSLNANAYFHVLVGKIAESMKPPISKAKAKNLMMARYGQEEIINGERYIISALSSIPMGEREDIHTKAIGYGYTNGKEFTHYCVLKPSHEYDTREMATLIDGTVEEAKALGIPTLAPDEIKHMEELWKANLQKT